MKTVEDIKKILVLGETGAVVECMLLDSVQDIKNKNEHLTDKEVKKVKSVLLAEIESIHETQEDNGEN